MADVADRRFWPDAPAVEPLPDGRERGRRPLRHGALFERNPPALRRARQAARRSRIRRPRHLDCLLRNSWLSLAARAPSDRFAATPQGKALVLHADGPPWCAARAISVSYQRLTLGSCGKSI